MSERICCECGSKDSDAKLALCPNCGEYVCVYCEEDEHDCVDADDEDDED